MAIKLMWAVKIEGFCTDIHGMIYTETEEEAISKLRETVLDDLEKLKAEEPWRDWSATLKCEGRLGCVHSLIGDADAWDQEKGVSYRVCRKRVTV